MPIVSVTEVIEVIGYQLWRGFSGCIASGNSDTFTNTIVIRAGIEKEVHIACLEPPLRPL